MARKGGGEVVDEDVYGGAGIESDQRPESQRTPRN